MWNMTSEVRRKDLEIYEPVSSYVQFTFAQLPFQNMKVYSNVKVEYSNKFSNAK